MISDQYIAVAALIAGVLSKGTRRHAALCFGFAFVYFFWHAIFGSPAVFSHVGYAWWFISCAVAESLIMVLAWLSASPASPYVAVLSTFNLLLNLWAGAVYKFSFLISAWPATSGFYHYIIPTVELLQLATLYLYSGPSLAVIRYCVRAYIRRRKRRASWFTAIHI